MFAGIVIYGRPLESKDFFDLRQGGFAVIYPACMCSIIFAAGPDGIHGSTPYHIIELLARTRPRVWPIPVTLFCHHIIITLAIKILLRICLCCSTRFSSERLTTIEQDPHNPGCLVGHRYQNHISWPARKQSFLPC